MTALESKALLVILDGFGVAADPSVSAVDLADTPFVDSLKEQNPTATLLASGEAVGLPDGQFGNSEVGHLNIGAGRIVWQELSRINNAIKEKSFFENQVLLDAIGKAKETGRLHIMGLFSDGGVHSHNEHLFAILELCKSHGLEQVFVHAFTDGRDTSPTGGKEYARQFEEKAAQIGTGTLATIIGRYYAMDRDNRWERVQLAYDALVHGKGTVYDSALAAFEASYAEKVTDEFIKPVVLRSESDSRIGSGDTVLFYNIRGDRAREITRALSQPGFNEFETEDLNLHYASFTQYDKTFEWVHVAFPPQDLVNTLGEWVSKKGLTQFRIAETEKYPHVTYFFNGGVEIPNEGESRTVIPSPKVATYDLQPEMSAPEVGDALVEALASEQYHLAILNFANPDMVGHTGDMQAAIKAVETVDAQLKRVIETASAHNYRSLIIADHGNADQMVKPDGSPHTAHTTVPVPAILVNAGEVALHNGILADVAPTLLKMMGLDQPDEMTGTPLY
ncbi:MAG: 2,3-bisphosphoglycerate-independent phosphoglycerate mutase [Bacteroidota bacterium]